jgi:hypothetical protein
VKATIFLHPYPSRKYGFMLARLLGHGSPSTALENYVFVTDSLISAFLSASELMRPEPRLVTRFCTLPESTWRDLTSKTGLSGIPVRLWRDGFPGLLAQFGKRKSDSGRFASAKTAENWVEQTWEFLHHSITEDVDPESLMKRHGFDEATADGIRLRVNYLAGLFLYPNERRHPMQVQQPGSTNPERKNQTNCPRHPRDSSDKIPAELATVLYEMRRNEHRRKLMQSALAIYVHNVDRENFVRFANLDKADDVRRFVHFMKNLGVPRINLRFVSGDPAPDSDSANAWRKYLRVVVEPRPSGGDFGSKTAISIRPNRILNPKITIGFPGFRFFLVMAYIAFGELGQPSNGVSSN